MDKDTLRRQILADRKILPEAERQAKQQQIFLRLLSVPGVQTAQTILLYLDFRGEVETSEILAWGWQTGKTMAVPLTLKESRRIIPVQIRSHADIQPGSYGIREPKPEIAEKGTLPAPTIDIVIVPGVAFDRRGVRLGYGGGYYDRFLPMLRSDTVKIGLAFELQMVERVPVEEHDVRLNYVVTEQRIIDCNT
jgi:5-formyltetrahydrofolate cyclo-ligase